MVRSLYFFVLSIALSSSVVQAQQNFTRKDSLYGGMRFERSCYNVLRYDLNLQLNINEKNLSGYNEITFNVVEDTPKIQLDLFEHMLIDSIVLSGNKLKFEREFNAVFVKFNQPLLKDSEQKMRFYYHGQPLIAKHAPWDGGFVFTKDSAGKDWVGLAVQGTGASLWFPCKDTQTDEPDLGCSIKVAVPNGLMNVSNGRFMGSTNLNNGYTRWDWEVKNPINNYDITLNIGDYVLFGETYKGLDLDFYVLRANEEKAKIQFEQVKPMMDCFQGKFGPYPFAEDGYKLVETPYLGMEHQSAVAYGNHYMNGYLGNDLSDTGVGLLFDFIIVHESGHEWFGNSITSKDIADMWIHEGFTCYSESVYLECLYGYDKAQTYINGLKRNVQNDKPIIGTYGVGNEGSGDMYYKGALMLNTIRHILNNDAQWWALILKYSTQFKHQMIDTPTVISFFNHETGLDLTPVFNQYLKHKELPILEAQLDASKKIKLRWKTNEPHFQLPVEVIVKGKIKRYLVGNDWLTTSVKTKGKLSESDFNSQKFFYQLSVLR